MTPTTRNHPAMAGATCHGLYYPAWWLLLAILLGGCDTPPPDRKLTDSDIAVHNNAVGLMGQFSYGPAVDKFALLAQRYPEQPELQVDLAIATLNRQQEGDETAALRLLGTLLEKHPGLLRAHYCSGLLKLHAGNAAAAAAHFQAVAEADPADAYAAYYLALSLAQISQNEAALPWYRKAIELDPYLRSGYYGAFQILRQQHQDDAAREMLDLYQRLGTNPRARLAEFKYTRMGPKAEVQALALPRKAAPPAPAGALFGPAAPLPIADQGAGPGAELAPRLAERSGLTTADIDGDGDLDLYATRVGAGSARPNVVLLQQADGRFVAQPEHPLAAVDGVNAALWGDIDNDRLVDVYLCRQGSNQLWRQREPGHWQDITAESGTAGGDHDSVDGMLFDADHDGDLDLFLVNADAPDELFNNNLDGTFRRLAAQYGIAGGSGSRTVLVTDLDRDRDADLVVLHAGAPNEVYLNELMWNYRPAPGFADFASASVAAALAQDRDADGRPELYTLGEDGGLSRWQPDADGRWTATPLTVDTGSGSAIQPGAASAGGPIAMLDINGDGLGELLLSTQHGWSAYALDGDRLRLLQRIEAPGLRHWLPVQTQAGDGPALVALSDAAGLTQWRPGPGRHPFVSLSLRGGDDNDATTRSNASGIGTYAAARIGEHWTSVDTYRNHSGPGQSLQPQAIGLGEAERMDFLAIEWSDGVFQSELNLEPGRLYPITETQRQLSSCPVLFAWDGERYRFVSDILGVGGLGYAVGPGEYAEPRPWENFQLPAGLLAAHAGRYRLKLTEPMEEAAYLDAARLIAYDLPPGWQLVLDERMGIGGPGPNGQALFFRSERQPVRALDNSGRDVTAAIARADLDAAPLGMLDTRFIGRLADPYRLELVFAEPLDAIEGEPVLVIDGWVEYPYSQTMFAAWQAGASYEAPSLDYHGADGRWHTLIEQFGYPAGMPRRMSLPLPELPAGVTRLRLRTNQEIYWDRISIAYVEALPSARRQALPLLAASVGESGFPGRTTGSQRQPEYDYDRRAPLWDTRHQAGFYTAFGRIDELLLETDDALAIIGPGEEIHMEFEAPDGQPPADWTRTFVLETNGWAKDMDLYTQNGNTLAPLPASGQPDAVVQQLHARYNTRYRSGL